MKKFNQAPPLFFVLVLLGITATAIESCAPKSRLESKSNTPQDPTLITFFASFDDKDDFSQETFNRSLNYGTNTIALTGGNHALKTPTKSGTIAITDNDDLIAVVNSTSGSVSFFSTATPGSPTSILTPVKLDFKTGKEPSSVTIDSPNSIAYVSNRADATVVKITNIRTNPSIVGTVSVGSEPTAVVLSPSGKLLFVAEWAQGQVSVIDTGTMQITKKLNSFKHPYALAVTNNGLGADQEGDELLVVTEFYGEPRLGRESKDDSRTGIVQFYRLSDLGQYNQVVFQPILTGFDPGLNRDAGTHLTSPNQLYSVALWGTKVLTTSISASPETDLNFDPRSGTPLPVASRVPFNATGNVFPVIYMGDLNTVTENKKLNSTFGGFQGSVNVAALIRDAIVAPAVPNFSGDIVDIAISPTESTFDASSNPTQIVGYVVSRAGNLIQRVSWDANLTPQIPNVQVNLNASPLNCKVPNGLVIRHDRAVAYVNCWNSRTVATVNLATNTVNETPATVLTPLSTADTLVSNGAKFFFTGTGRWSKNSWSSCASCHSEGRTDNITWSFNTGPRMSSSLDGSFSHGPGVQKQRVFNWSGIFDEVHDFERNTRGTQFGFGAVVQPQPDNTGCGNTTTEIQKAIATITNLGTPMKEVADTAPTCNGGDFDAIEAWMKTIRPPLRNVTSPRVVESIARGRQLFQTGKCNGCHAGSGWTLSKRFFTPSTATNTELANPSLKPFFAAASAPPEWFSPFSAQIAGQPDNVDTILNADSGNNKVQSIACSLRNIGTFGARNSDGSLNTLQTNDLELKNNLTRAAGPAGYNIPSLYGLALRGPFFHHGQAATLDDALFNPRWASHLNAGNTNFLSELSDQDRLDLKRFLLAIDATTPEMDPPSGFDTCSVR